MAQGTWPHVCQYNLDYHGCNQVYMPIGGPPLSEVAGSCASFDARSSIHGMTAVSQGNTTSLYVGQCPGLHSHGHCWLQ